MTERHRSDLSAAKAQYRYLLNFAFQKYGVKCFFCGRPLTLEDLPPRGTPLVTKHHADHDHMNDKPANCWFSHRSCHKSYEAKYTHSKYKEPI